MPDPPRLVPLPSLASEAYRRAVTEWISAACTALSPALARGTIARVVLSFAPPALLRDDPFEADHHPDARADPSQPAPLPARTGSQTDALAHVRRETDRAANFLRALVHTCASHAIPAARIALALPGSPEVSALALALAREHRLLFSMPPPRVGAATLWRQVRFAMALPLVSHLELRAGTAPFEAPSRATHDALAARVALAAGAQDYSVRMGCSGERWIGALLDDRGEPRAHAPRWSALNAFARALPTGTERCATLVTPPASIDSVRAATGVHPLPLGLLAALGHRPGELAAEGALDAGALDGTAHATRERTLRALESDLVRAAIPVRHAPAPDPPDDPCAYTSGDPAAFLARCHASLGALAPTLRPEGGARVRAVATPDALCLVLVSTHDAVVEVSSPAGTWVAHGTGAPVPHALSPGETLVLALAGAPP